MIGRERPPVAQVDDFFRLDIRVGRIIAAEAFPEARKPAYRLTIDFGPDEGRKRASAQITDLYSARDLIGRQVLALINIPPRRIGPFLSEVLVLGVPGPTGAVVLVGPERPVPEGGRMY